jgi:hypothetical protein
MRAVRSDSWRKRKRTASAEGRESATYEKGPFQPTKSLKKILESCPDGYLPLTRQKVANSCLRIQWGFARTGPAPSSMKFETHTTDIKPAGLWTDGNLPAVRAL